jgi:hypothetical protein
VRCKSELASATSPHLVDVRCGAGDLDAQAGDQLKILDGKQIQARVVGQDTTDGPHWSKYMRRDGALIGEESGSSWTGSWKIKNDRLCLTLSNVTSAECNEVWMSGALIRMRASRDEETFDAMIAVHRRK